MLCSRLRTFFVLGSLLVSTACASGSGRGAPAPDDSANLPVEVRLQRMAPEATITRSNEGIAVKIRGAPSSHTGQDPDPLFILNGIQFQPGLGGILTGIDPNVIAAIKVLRGGEAALYGIRGANGVIVITTKRPGSTKP
jgi:TonB-dependent SusC/RagA subfamily outer membrane receptor